MRMPMPILVSRAIADSMNPYVILKVEYERDKVTEHRTKTQWSAGVNATIDEEFSGSELYLPYPPTLLAPVPDHRRSCVFGATSI